jgi:Ran GTPase-activating protein (RanGAP) involved in mRNA processing and transport
VKFWTKKLQIPTSRRKEANNKGKVAFSAYMSQQRVSGLGQALLANSATDTLELAGSGFDADKIAIFAEALKTDKNIKRLRIDNSSKIGAAGAASIAEMLKENSTIYSPDMSSCGLGPEGTAVVAASLEQNKSVTRLVLSTNDILVLGTEAIGSLLRTNKVIEVLDSSKNGLGDEGARRLGLSLKSNTSLQRLTMKANNIGTHGANRLNVALSGNETLVELDLYDNPIGEAGARTLEQMLSKHRCRMRDLKLDNCSLGRAGIELLANDIRKSSSLRRLDLRSNDFGDVGAKLLMEAIQSNSLEELTISDNEIGPIGAKAAAEILRVNGSLKTLNISANDVGDAGVIAVAKALAENPSTKLSKLFLNSNRVGDVGAVALGDMLKNYQMLVELHIASNEIKMQGFEAIARGQEANKKLTELKHDKGWTADSDEGAEIIEKLKQHLVDNGSASKGALFKAPDMPKDSSVSLSIA